MQQPARLAADQEHVFLHCQAADLSPCSRPDRATAPQSMSNISSNIISILRPLRYTPPVNQGLNKLGHWLSSLCNIYIHLFYGLQISDHAIRLMSRDHLDLLDLQLLRTFRQLSLSTLFDSTDFQYRRDYTDIISPHHFYIHATFYLQLTQ